MSHLIKGKSLSYQLFRSNLFILFLARKRTGNFPYGIEGNYTNLICHIISTQSTLQRSQSLQGVLIMPEFQFNILNIVLSVWKTLMHHSVTKSRRIAPLYLYNAMRMVIATAFRPKLSMSLAPKSFLFSFQQSDEF